MVPTVSFTVLSDELHVDLNEDGFTLQDTISICSTGESSKKDNLEKIGEKGFGFKSVFGLADQVQVQSGLWSFYFKHRRNENGLGMITPIWQEGGKLPAGVNTRFTLRYRQTGQDSSDTVRNVWQQLHTQEPSLLFALRKLQRISINFLNAGASNDTICFERQSSLSKGSMIIKSTTANHTTTQSFRTFSRTIEDMPKSEGRTGSSSTIQIAFPVTALLNGVPTIEQTGQFVFAYLPIERLPNLHFLIHADFLLPGSRQSVIDNVWNKKLRTEIAKLFIRSISKFAAEKKESLSYHWLSYMPKGMTKFWQPLEDEIIERLRCKSFFLSRAEELDLPSTRRILPETFTHGGEPLLPETASWRFLSSKYPHRFLPTLKRLGVQDVSNEDALQLISSDLSKPDSIFRRHPLSDEWHYSILKFIGRMYNLQALKSKINNLCLVPVLRGSKLEWTQPWQSIYWPNVVNEGSDSERLVIDMPTDLNIVVLHPDAARAPERRKIFQDFGVTACSPLRICDAVVRASTALGSKSSQDMLKHFELLFWFSHKLDSEAQNGLVAFTADQAYLNRSRLLFMRSNDEYHAEQLLCLEKNPHLKLKFLSPIYQASRISTRSRGGLTWEQWLRNIAGVRWYPALSDPNDENKLHTVIEAIRKDNPKKFVPMIQHHWADDYSKSNDKIREALKECEVLCQRDVFEKLGKAWFPTKAILYAAAEYKVDTKLPILSLPGQMGGQTIFQWPALSVLGVRSELDLSFYKDVLLLHSSGGGEPAIDVAKMNRLYANVGNLITLQGQRSFRVSDNIAYMLLLTRGRRNSRIFGSSGIPSRKYGTLSKNASGRAALH